MIIFDKKKKIEVSDERLFKRLGYPTDYDPPAYVEELIDWTKSWFEAHGNPWSNFYELEVSMYSNTLYFDHIKIESPKLLKRYKKHHVRKAILIATTAGDKLDKKVNELWKDDISDQSFFLDAFGSAYAEVMISTSARFIQKWANKKGLHALSRFSPGYPGWDLKDQHSIMKIIKEKKHKHLPIQVLESSLLTPKKSQFSVIGLHRGQEGNEVPTACATCSLLDCKCIKEKRV